MNRLDLCFLNRPPRPITVSPVREIEKRAAWGAFKEDCASVATFILTAAAIGMIVLGVMG